MSKEAHAPLTILFQDDWLVAVDKPAGHLVHPADHPAEDDLVTMKILRDQIGQRVYNIHRIDRPTTGVLLFGTDRTAARHMHRALERHQIQKTYWAVTCGRPAQTDWECTLPLQKNDTAPLREAHTSFKRLAVTSPACLHGLNTSTLTLVEARPHTGRFHQIRRHLALLGHPIVGDFRYTGIEECERLGGQLGTGKRMLLQSKSLSFTHPVTTAPIHIEAPVDPCFRACFPEL